MDTNVIFSFFGESDFRESDRPETDIDTLLLEMLDKHVGCKNVNDLVERTTLLSYAVGRDNSLAVQTLLEKGADPNLASHVFDPVRRVWRLETPLITAARLGHHRTVTILVRNGAMINVVDPDKGKSPLHWACAGNFSDTAKYLVKCGANVHLRDYYWEPPIVEAISSGDEALVRDLVFSGVKLNEYLSNDRDTALLLALLINQHDIAEFLLEAGAPVDALNRESEDALWAVLTYCRCDSTAIRLSQKLITAGFKVHNGHLNKAGNVKGTPLFQLLNNASSEKSVASLRVQSRTAIRNHLFSKTMGRQILCSLEQLPLPKLLISYLKLQW